MKKCTVAIAALSLISMTCAFEDKPALGRIERAALTTAKGVGTTAGAVTGTVAGAGLGYGILHISPEKDMCSYPKKVSKDLTTVLAVMPTLCGSTVAGIIGGYKGGKSLAILALAKLHGVSYRVEAISQHYNINVSQYKPILVAAAAQDPEGLLQAIDEVYTQRFGEQWKEKLPKLFKKYRKRARILAKESSFIRKDKLKDFLRIVELGAAMANLYFGTNPNKEYTVNSAIELYEELGLLN